MAAGREEFSMVRTKLDELANKAYNEHKKVFEKWEHGDIKKVWFEDMTLCIEYESGRWFHYMWLSNNGLQYW